MTYIKIAQKAVHHIVALNVASAIETAVDDHTEYDSDSITVQVGSMVIGQVVAKQTDRITDPAVVKAAGALSTLKSKIANRKSQES
jgi:hypothetical protein